MSTSYIKDTILNATIKSSINIHEHIGCCDKNFVDGLAVNVIRETFKESGLSLKVIVGEGEKDHAPMLYNGESFGISPHEYDIALDPVEGTRSAAYGKPGSVSVIGASTGNSIKIDSSYFYMFKCLTYSSIALDDILDIHTLLDRVSIVTKKDIKDIQVVILDRDRHKKYIEEFHRYGAKVHLFDDGDVVESLRVGKSYDILYGIGGVTEGVLMSMIAINSNDLSLWWQYVDFNTLIPINSLQDQYSIIGDTAPILCMTAITDTPFGNGVRVCGEKLIINSLIIESKSKRYIKTVKNL